MISSISDETFRLSIIKEVLSAEKHLLHEVEVGVESMDDAALIRISETESLVIASDFIRGSGFFLFEMGYLDYFDMGYYLIAANVSDIAAMGARPMAITTIFRIRRIPSLV